MCYTLLDTVGNDKNKRKTFLSLPILVTQICKEWMLKDEFNHALKNKIGIQTENIFSSYNASVQIDLVPSMIQEYVSVASSSSGGWWILYSTTTWKYSCIHAFNLGGDKKNI